MSLALVEVERNLKNAADNNNMGTHRHRSTPPKKPAQPSQPTEVQVRQNLRGQSLLGRRVAQKQDGFSLKGLLIHLLIFSGSILAGAGTGYMMQRDLSDKLQTSDLALKNCERDLIFPASWGVDADLCLAPHLTDNEKLVQAYNEQGPEYTNRMIKCLDEEAQNLFLKDRHICNLRKSIPSERTQCQKEAGDELFHTLNEHIDFACKHTKISDDDMPCKLAKAYLNQSIPIPEKTSLIQRPCKSLWG